MNLAQFISDGGDPSKFHFCQVLFERNTARSGKHMATARFEGIDEDGNAICRHNGVQENAWYIPYRLDPQDVTLVLNDDKPVPYDARPLTQ